MECMLKYLCLDKIIYTTIKIKESNEETLKWVLEHWTFIKKLPQIYQDYCYNAIDQKYVQLQPSLALCTLNSHLRLNVSEHEGVLYINIKKKVYEQLLEKEAVKKYLSNGGITGLSFSDLRYTKELFDVDETVQLKTFLLNCQSTLKSVNICIWYDVGNDENIMYPLFEDLVVCQQIKSFNGFIMRGILYKYILGIDYKDIDNANTLIFKIRTSNDSNHISEQTQLWMTEMHRIISSSKPSWPKVTNINIEETLFEETLLEANTLLPYAILKDLMTFHTKPLEMSPLYFNEHVLKNLTKPCFENRITNVGIEKINLLCENNFFADQVIFSIDYFFYNEYDVPFSESTLMEQGFWKNCYLYQHMVCMTVLFPFDDEAFTKLFVNLISNSPNLKQIQIIPYLINIESYLPSACSVVVETLVIEYVPYPNPNYSNLDLFTIKKIFTIIPFIKNLNLIFYACDTNEEKSTSQIVCLPDLECLESINVLINRFSSVNRNIPVLPLMVNISNTVKKHTLLTYAAEFNFPSKYKSILRLNGWISVSQNNIPFRDEPILHHTVPWMAHNDPRINVKYDKRFD